MNRIWPVPINGENNFRLLTKQVKKMKGYRQCRICGEMAKLESYSANYGELPEYNYRCQCGYTFTLNGLKEVIGPPEDMTKSYRGRVRKIFLTLPKSLSGSTQWVES